MARRPAHVIAMTAVTAMMLAGCGTKENNDMPDDTPTTTGLVTPAPLEGRPSMDQMLEHYRKVINEVMTAVDSEYGPMGWKPFDETEGQAACGSGIDPDQPTLPDGAISGIGTRMSSKVPPAGAADDVRALIETVTSKHGFTHVQVVEETDTALQIFAYDKYDTRLSFGYDKATATSLRTGCFPTD